MSMRRTSCPAGFPQANNFTLQSRRLSVNTEVDFPLPVSHRMTDSVLLMILEFCEFESPKQLCELELVSRQFKLALSGKGDEIWKRMLVRHWGSDTIVQKELHLSFKQV